MIFFSLLRLFAKDNLKAMVGRLGMNTGEPIEHAMVSRVIETAQVLSFSSSGPPIIRQSEALRTRNRDLKCELAPHSGCGADRHISFMLFHDFEQHRKSEIKMDKVEEKTAGGIFIPQTAQEKTQIAVVEAIGDDVKTIKVGQKILHDKYAGTSVKMDNEEYLILNIKDVLAIVG